MSGMREEFVEIGLRKELVVQIVDHIVVWKPNEIAGKEADIFTEKGCKEIENQNIVIDDEIKFVSVCMTVSVMNWKEITVPLNMPWKVTEDQST